LHHHLIKNPIAYPYSSYARIIGHQPTLLQRDQILEWFDGQKNFIDYHRMQFELDSQDLFDDD
jgi:hypothetical protein